jgi:hypothetical protein
LPAAVVAGFVVCAVVVEVVLAALVVVVAAATVVALWVDVVVVDDVVQDPKTIEITIRQVSTIQNVPLFNVHSFLIENC